MIVDEIVAILGFETKGEGELQRFEQRLESAAKSIGMLAAAAGAAAAGAMVALGKSVISTSAQFESYQATLETIEGSSEKAKASLDWVADFAKTTPYDIAGVTESFVRLKAYGIDPMDGTLRAAGDAGAAMGYGLMQGVEAIADAMTGENERLKAFGITTSTAGEQITYSWQENGKTLTKTLKKNGAEIVKFLNENFGRRFGGAMDKQSKTWNGMIANLGDTWTDFERRIGEAGFFDTVKGQLRKVMDYIDRLDKDGTIDRWATNLSRAFVASTNAIGFAFDHLSKDVVTTIDLLGRAGGYISEVIKKLTGGTIDLSNWQTVATFFGLLAARLFPVTAFLTVAYLALNDFLTYMRGGESVLGKFIDSLAAFLGAEPQAVAEALGAIATSAAGLAVAAVGIVKISGAVRGLARALGLMSSANVGKGIDAIGAAGKAGGNTGKTGGSPAKSGGGFDLSSLWGVVNAIYLATSIPDDKQGVEEMIKANTERSNAANDWLEERGLSPSSRLRSHVAANSTKYAGDAKTAAAEGQGLSAFAGFEDRMDGGGAVVPSPEQAAAASLAWLKNAFSSITAKLDNPMFLKGLENLQANAAATQPAAAAAAVSATMTDNRQYPVTVNSTVNQTVTQATQAPAAAAQATSQAVGRAASARDSTRLYNE